MFYYALHTTGIVCCPSCTARRCDLKNVVLFDTLQQAVDAGFRPCLRCRPDQPDWEGAKAELVETVKDYISAHYTEKFSLTDLAGSAYVNKNYLIRVFKEATGHTPLWYHNYTRCLSAAELLARPEFSATEIIWQVGYVSPSHFAKVFRKIFNVSPTKYRKRYLKNLSE